MLAAVAGAALAAATPAHALEWYAGDGHVHTCYSHDAYCPGIDPIEDAETFYSSAGTVQERFTEAAAKDLDYLAISDHDDQRAWTDPAFGSQGVLGLQAYEWSLDGGHAQMLGALRSYGDGEPAATADALNADGGLFQANHPSYRADADVTTCAEAGAPDTALHWRLGFAVRPDTIEVWNPTALIPPGELYWECWLQRGVRIPVTSGSDSHGATQPTAGMPTTWVLARERTQEAILEGIRLGRTTLSRLPPGLGGARLLLEADGDRDGTYEATMGDTVRPRTPMRVRADGLSAPALVRVRAGGQTLVEDAPLAPGGEVTFSAPKTSTWVRAVTYQQQWTTVADPFCRPPASTESPVDFCTTDLAITAMTSPLYVEKPGNGVPPAKATATIRPLPVTPILDELDDEPTLAPAAQSLNGAPLPDVPAQAYAPQRAGFALPAVSVRRADRRAAWGPVGQRFDVQALLRGRWRVVGQATTATSARLGRRARALRVRVRTPDGRAGPWRRG